MVVFELYTNTHTRTEESENTNGVSPVWDLSVTGRIVPGSYSTQLVSGVVWMTGYGSSSRRGPSDVHTLDL